MCQATHTYTHFLLVSTNNFFFLNFLKYKTRSSKYLKHMLLRLVAYELTDAVWQRLLAVCSHRVINHRPWVYGNGLQTLSTPISCNYEPSERWIQGEYDFRLSGTSWLMVWWVRISPCCDFTGSLKPLKLSTAGSFFQHLKRGKKGKGKKGSKRFQMVSKPRLSLCQWPSHIAYN